MQGFLRSILKQGRLGLTGAVIAGFLSACGAREVVVRGNFPEPLMDPIPITVGVVFPDAFKQHEIFDKAAGRAESDWIVKTGDAQAELWTTTFEGMFENVIFLNDSTSVNTLSDEVEVVIIPRIEDLQYTIPLYTSIKIYEIWLKYQFKFVPVEAVRKAEDGGITIDSSLGSAEYTFTGYGKTPTAFLQSDEEAVNLAAVVALRDGGANFISSNPDLESFRSLLVFKDIGKGKVPESTLSDDLGEQGDII